MRNRDKKKEIAALVDKRTLALAGVGTYRTRDPKRAAEYKQSAIVLDTKILKLGGESAFMINEVLGGEIILPISGKGIFSEVATQTITLESLNAAGRLIEDIGPTITKIEVKNLRFFEFAISGITELIKSNPSGICPPATYCGFPIKASKGVPLNEAHIFYSDGTVKKIPFVKISVTFK